MQYIMSSDFQIQNSAVALGKFEGIHLGHQLLLNELMKQKEKGLNSVVFTFDIPPKAVIQGNRNYSLIFTKTERRLFLEKQGIDILVEHPFTKEFAASTPEEFIRDVLMEKMDARAIVVGSDFHFGKKRSGNVDTLREASARYGFELIILNKVQSDGREISSTRIRKLIECGKMEEAAQLLGRNFSIYGQVIHGRALGRTIQIPTANIRPEDLKLIPPNGVYLSKVHIDDKVYKGITNIGVKPTVEEIPVKGVETYIFDFSEDIYGKNIDVELLHFHRAELRFKDVNELKEQMNKDILYAKNYFLQFA
ncbi:MAG: bifunctional riboflavin kinase/FAD synthetase [Eubacterium sp.]|nr:bifunctional riboflavin kinase/FAD synthetase [Eubacterium sp.]